jgi:hypothetical protein
MKITKLRLKQIIKEELGYVLHEIEEPTSNASFSERIYNLYRPAADIGYDVREDASDDLKSRLDAWAIMAIDKKGPGEGPRPGLGASAYDSQEKIMAAVQKTTENELKASQDYTADIEDLRKAADASGMPTRWPRGASERRAQFDRDMQMADRPIKALKGYEIVEIIYDAWEEANYDHEDEMGY